MNRNEAVDTIKEVLCISDFMFPEAFSLESKSASDYRVRIKINKRDRLTIEEFATKEGLVVNEERGVIVIYRR